MKAWKRLLLLLSGASRLTWLYRVPKDRVLEPEDNPRCEPGPGPRPPSIPSRPRAESLTPPGFTDASTTLQGLLLRCPVMRSFRKGFSPSATRA